MEVIELADGGVLQFWPSWIQAERADELFDRLQRELPWQQRELKMFGKPVLEPRLTVWVGDPEASYRYSGRDHKPLPWPVLLQELRAELEVLLESPFNGLLANLYRDERDSMGWHADNEKELGKNPTIASVSLGQSRRFWLKHASAEKVALQLEHGSLLVMRGTTQHHWKHCVPKETQPRSPRINLTFRRIYSGR